jgi:hypothetical protein
MPGAARTHPARGLIAVVAICGLMVSACGSSNSSSKASVAPTPTPTPQATLTPNVDACKLVTAADVLSATGLAVTNPAATAGAQMPACVYITADATTTVLVVANAYPDATSANALTPDQLAAPFSSVYGIKDPKQISGIGDKAIEYTTTSTASGATGAVLFVFKSKFVILIAITPSTDPTAVESLGRTAVSHLPSG